MGHVALFLLNTFNDVLVALRNLVYLHLFTSVLLLFFSNSLGYDYKSMVVRFLFLIFMKDMAE